MLLVKTIQELPIIQYLLQSVVTSPLIHPVLIYTYVGILGTGQEACSEEAFPLHQLVDEPQQVHQSTG